MRGPIEGVLVVDKPAGMTSHDVVARVRRLAGTRKVGHAGTLDPMATGVLVCGIGRATKLLGHLILADKEYLATVRLGQSTTTDDAEGELTGQANAADLDRGGVRDAFATQVGEIDQVPAAVSAIKVDGKRAYQRVRDGEEVALPARRVRIDELEITDVAAGDAVLDVQVRVKCSSGTYIRSIARDVGQLLGVGGHLIALRRTQAGPFDVADCVVLGELAESEVPVLGLAEVAGRSYPTVTVSAEHAEDIRFGRRLPLVLAAPSALLNTDGDLLALAETVDGRMSFLGVFTQNH